MLIKISAILLLTVSTKQLQLWFSATRASNQQTSAVTLGGSDEEYLVHGADKVFEAERIDYQAGSTGTTITTTLGPPLSGLTAGLMSLASYGTSKVLFVHRRIAIVDFISGAVDHIFTLASDEYPHNPATRINATDYFMVTSQFAPTNLLNAYRLLISSHPPSSVKFKLEQRATASGVISMTNFYVVSEFAKTHRKVFDYTNGYDGLSTSGIIASHAKLGGETDTEQGFISPQAIEAQVYVVGVAVQVVTVNWPEGAARLSKNLGPDGNSDQVKTMVWIPDTNLCFVASSGESIWITNFLDEVLSTRYSKLPNSELNNEQSYISLTKRVTVLSAYVPPKINVYKIADEYPCSGLCLTCDVIVRGKCTSCRMNAEATPSGDSCKCKSNYYEQLKTFSRSECLQCSLLCQDCSGGKTNDCTSCRYPAVMDVKSNGSCACKDGLFSTGATTCEPCDSSCLTCSKLGKYGCTSCEPLSKYLVEDGRCLSCDFPCKTCSGSGTNRCLSCYQDKPFWFNSPGRTCPFCNYLCGTCSGPSDTQCLTCSFLAFESSPGPCVSCAEGDSSTCPPPVNLSIGEKLEDNNKVLKITMTPALTFNHPNPDQVTAEMLLQKHLRITIKKKSQEQSTTIQIETTNLNHSTTNSELTIRFKGEVNAFEVEKLRVEVTDPWIYKTGVAETPEKVIYTKKKSHEMEIKEPEQDLNSLAFARLLANILSATVATGFLSILLLQACKLVENVSIYAFFRYMNIIDMLLSITKSNVELEPRLLILTEFLENLKIPKIGFIERASPIWNSDEGKRDANAHVELPRGRRGKLTNQNEDLFIFTGQNFFISLTTLIFYVLMKILERCLQTKNRVLIVITYCYQILISILFYDFQLICLTELAFADPKKLGSHSIKFIISWFASLAIVTITVREQIQGFMLMRSTTLQMTKTKKINKKIKNNNMGQKVKNNNINNNKLTFNDEMVIEKFSQGLATGVDGLTMLFNVIDSVRFTLMLVVICSLQQLEKSQVVILVIISTFYLIYFCVVVESRLRFFNSEVIKVKFFVQEACILITAIGLCVFSYKNGTAWSKTIAYRFLQTLVLISVAVAFLLEFFVVLRECYRGLKDLCRKKKRSKTAAREVDWESKGIQTDQQKVSLKVNSRLRRPPSSAKNTKNIDVWKISDLPGAKKPKQTHKTENKLRRRSNRFSQKGKNGNEYLELKSSARSDLVLNGNVSESGKNLENLKE